jgi:hypothetical protein
MSERPTSMNDTRTHTAAACVARREPTFDNNSIIYVSGLLEDLSTSRD